MAANGAGIIGLLCGSNFGVGIAENEDWEIDGKAPWEAWRKVAMEPEERSSNVSGQT